MKMADMGWGTPNPKLRKYGDAGSFTPGFWGALRRYQKANLYGRFLISCIEKNDHEGIDLMLDQTPELINRPIFYRMNLASIDYRYVWRTPLEAAVCERASLNTIMKLIERGAKIEESVLIMCDRYDTNEHAVGADEGDRVRSMIKRHELGLIASKPVQAPKPPPKM